jgi:hypothetical protein
LDTGNSTSNNEPPPSTGEEPETNIPESDQTPVIEVPETNGGGAEGDQTQPNGQPAAPLIANENGESEIINQHGQVNGVNENTLQLQGEPTSSLLGSDRGTNHQFGNAANSSGFGTERNGHQLPYYNGQMMTDINQQQQQRQPSIYHSLPPAHDLTDETFLDMPPGLGPMPPYQATPVTEPQYGQYNNSNNLFPMGPPNPQVQRHGSGTSDPTSPFSSISSPASMDSTSLSGNLSENDIDETSVDPIQLALRMSSTYAYCSSF